MYQQIRVLSNNNLSFYRFSALFTGHQKCSIHKQTVYEKLNIAPKPKRPMTPYLQFLSQVRPAIAKEFPGLKNTELVKIAAQRWNSVDSTVKNKLTLQFHEASTQYNQLKEEYEKQLTPDQKAAILRAEQFERDLKKEKKTKKKSLELGRPKRPVSAFFKYLNNRSSDKHKYPSAKEFVKAASEEWNALSPEVKARYEDERKREYDIWQQQLADWEQKMIKEGNIDVDEVCPGSIVSTAGEESQGTDTCQRDSLKQLPYSKSAIPQNVILSTQQKCEKLKTSQRKDESNEELHSKVLVDSDKSTNTLGLSTPIKFQTNESEDLKISTNLIELPKVRSRKVLVKSNVSNKVVESSATKFKHKDCSEDKQLKEFAHKIEKNVLETRTEGNVEKHGRWWEKIIDKIKK